MIKNNLKLSKWWSLPVALTIIWTALQLSGMGGVVGHLLRDLFGLPLSIIIPAAVFVLYFLPTFIASNREKKALNSIFIINLLLGWSFVFWVLSLSWAVYPEEN